PVAFHTSHGRGLKLYFVETDDFKADELAAIAASALLNRDRRATADLVRTSRHPGYARPGYPACGPVHYQTPGDDVTAARALFADRKEIDPENRDEYLNDSGRQVGQSLPHEECPINPCSSHGTPVFLGEHGIYCHKCTAAGQTHPGCGKPGFVPW